MKILILIISHECDEKYCDNIRILRDYMTSTDREVDYCGISNQDDFSNYENIIKFKYKIINTGKQLSKICDFITDYKGELDYDWYMKIRPDIKLLQNIDFDSLSKNAINARARSYRGPSKIKYGMSINGEGPYKKEGDRFYSEREDDILPFTFDQLSSFELLNHTYLLPRQNIILDDQLYIFHNNVVLNNGFDKLDEKLNYLNQHHEWVHTGIFNIRKIPLNVIGIWCTHTKYNNTSGDTY